MLECLHLQMQIPIKYFTPQFFLSLYLHVIYRSVCASHFCPSVCARVFAVYMCVRPSIRVGVFLYQYDLELSSRQFGVEVSRLTSEERTVPLVVEKLINYIEMHGLYTEGIYRKSGSTNKIKELKQGLDTGTVYMLT